MKQVWIAVNPWTPDNDDGYNPLIWGAFPADADAWAYIKHELTGADQANSVVWGPVELYGELPPGSQEVK